MIVQLRFLWFVLSEIFKRKKPRNEQESPRGLQSISAAYSGKGRCLMSKNHTLFPDISVQRELLLIYTCKSVGIGKHVVMPGLH
jgi:hypothetical protein